MRDGLNTGGRSTALTARTDSYPVSQEPPELTGTQQFVVMAILWLIVVTLLGFVAFGVRTTLEVEFEIVSFPFRHPDDTWFFIKTIATVLFIFSFIAVLVGLANPEYRTPPGGSRRNPHEIENFREKSPYGDASLAQRDQVARALQMNTEPTPKFEE